MQKLTKEQAVVLTGYTGVTCCQFSDFHKEVESRLGRPIWTHEFANKDMMRKVQDLFREDFMAMVGGE